MKTKIRPLAMKCNQEQFDSIKDRINLPIKTINRFEDCHYLVNNFNFDGQISNINKYEWIEKDYEIHETFNADIFLEACGVDVEKIWRSEEMEFLSKLGVWSDFAYDFKVRFKPQPSYQKEIQALQQKAKENGQSVTIVFEKL